MTEGENLLIRQLKNEVEGVTGGEEDFLWSLLNKYMAHDIPEVLRGRLIDLRDKRIGVPEPPPPRERLKPVPPPEKKRRSKDSVSLTEAMKPKPAKAKPAKVKTGKPEYKPLKEEDIPFMIGLAFMCIGML